MSSSIIISLFFFAIAIIIIQTTNSFMNPIILLHSRKSIQIPYHYVKNTYGNQYLYKFSSLSQSSSSSTLNDGDENDETLLKEINKEQLEALCNQFNISDKGTKEELLARLRQYAETQAKKDEDTRKRQIQRIEQGVDDTQGNGKAKHKIISSNDNSVDDDESDETELEGSFYFSIPGDDKSKKNETTVTRTTTKIMNPQNSPMNTITAPLPPPGLEPNEDGERVVTVYSTKDQNDLTGLAAQNSFNSANDAAMMGGYSRTDSMGSDPENTLAGGPFGDQSGSKRKKASSKEYDAAIEILSDLVLSLVQMTGAPGFQDEFTDGVLPYDEATKKTTKDDDRVNYHSEFGFIGFDPSRVPVAMLTQSSKSLRVANGDAIREVLNQFEMQAIGFDGMAGDNKEKGGGHYLEVQKVGTFLEGFRKAEVRRVARETATMLLDKLVSEGVKSLDQMLMTMTKGSDEASDAGELNDSLIDYLEDAVRQQEKKVEQKLGKIGVEECQINSLAGVEDIDLSGGLSDSFWNMTVDDNGKIIESLDPNDPQVKAVLEKELEIAKKKIDSRSKIMPTDPSQQLLILLMLLRERVKAEAMFANDEKGNNLRILAYCLHASNEKERETVLMDNIGTSLDVSFC